MERAAARQQSIKPGMERDQRAHTLCSMHVGVHEEEVCCWSAALTLLSSRSRTRWRVSCPGHENWGRGAAASHVGRNQPEIHAQPGKKLVPQQELAVSQQGMKTINRNHSRLLRVHLILPSLFCPSLIFASFPFIS